MNIKPNLRKFLAPLCLLAICQGSGTTNDDLARNDFMYAGESKRRLIHIIKNGRVAWSHDEPTRRGEISDAMLLTNGNILIAHQYGLMEIAPDHSVVWSFDAPEKTEIHTVQPIGDDMVVFVRNGLPAKVVVMEKKSRNVLREFEIPIDQNKSMHGQFRNARLTSRGTLVIANMGLGYIGEYDSNGKEISRWDFQGPWSVSEIGKDTLLLVGNGKRVVEMDRDGRVIWEMKVDSLGINSPQKAVRLTNGNTIVNNWVNEWSKTPMDSVNPPLQAIEFTPAGEVVWTLRSWRDPDLGPSTTIQPLDQPVDPSRLFFGEFKPVKR